MNSSFPKQITLYRFRYVIAYAFVAALTVGLSLWQINSIPDGLTGGEQQTIIHSATLEPHTHTSPINLPFYVLEKLSLHLFGFTTFGIKLPALLLGIASGLMLLLLLLRLFRKNVAIITALFAVTASQFLIATRTADTSIMLLFWPIAIMLLMTLISQKAAQARLLGFLLAATIGLSLYTPFMAYLIVAALFAALIHPHLRFVAKAQGRPFWLALQLVVFLVVIAPLVWSLAHNAGQISDLLGIIPKSADVRVYWNNLYSALKQYADFTHPTIGVAIAPAFNIGALILILLGFLRVVVDHFSARSHMLLVWLVFLVVVTSIKTQTLVLLFVPSIMLLGIGVQALIREWYKLFPRNPYARAVGLLPLGTFIIMALAFNYTSYFFGMAYAPQASTAYSNDFKLLRANVTTPPNTRTLVFATSSEQPLYDLLRRENPKLQVVDVARATLPTQPEAVYVSTAAMSEVPAAVSDHLVAQSVVVNSRSVAPLRFVEYTIK